MSSQTPKNAGFEKWLIAKPHGGLNDVLCQIEKSWRFAERNGRNLVIDSLSTGINTDFFEVFEPKSQRDRNFCFRPSSDLYELLAIESIFPEALSGRLLTYKSHPDSNRIYRDDIHQENLSFDFSHDPESTVLLHEAEGGGVESESLLARVALTRQSQSDVAQFLTEAPSGYVSVHIRFSDLTTDYNFVLREVRKRHPDSDVFVASDSPSVHLAAEEMFGEKLIFSPSRKIMPSQGPLHRSEMGPHESRRRLILTLADLFWVSNAHHYYYANVNEFRAVSGFSRLAAYLAANPRVRLGLLPNYTELLSDQHGSITHLASLTDRAYERIRWTGKRLKRSKN